MNIVKILLKIFVILLITMAALFGINHQNNNKVMGKWTELQKWSQKKLYSCNDYIYLSEDGALELENKTKSSGFSKCVNSKINEVNSITLKNIKFENFEESRIIAEMVKEHEIPVTVMGTCEIECLDILMHSPESKICNTSEVSLQRIDRIRLGTSEFFDYIRVLKEKHVMETYKDSDVNSEFLLNNLKSLNFYKSKKITQKELLENNLVDSVIECE